MLPSTSFTPDRHLCYPPAAPTNPRNAAWAARLQRAFAGSIEIAAVRAKVRTYKGGNDAL